MRLIKEQKRPEKKRSLKWSLISLVVACWILPLVLIGIITSYFITNKMDNHITETISASLRLNEELCLNRMDSAVESSRFASYDKSIWSAYSWYGEKKTDVEAIQLNNVVSSFLSKQYCYDDKFVLTMLYFIQSPDTVYYASNAVKGNRWKARTSDYSGVTYFKRKVQSRVEECSQTLGTGIEFLNVDGRVYMIRNLVSPENYEPYAVLVMQLNISTFFDGIKSVAWSKNATVWLNEVPVLLKGTAFSVAKEHFKFANGYNGHIEVDGRSMIYGQDSRSGYTFAYMIETDSSALTGDMKNFRYLLYGMMILIVPMLLFVIYYFYSNVGDPINGLVQGAKEIEIGRLGYQLDGKFDSREFQYLADAFNEMSAQLKHQFDKIYMEELALRDAKIMALQSQINPHFLNNTLEIINWEARIGGNAKVSLMIESLSTMLDAAMDRKGKPTVRLSEEMMYVDAYLYIISERLGKRMVVKKEIDETLLDVQVPRLIMQPIIENAVEHGVQPKQGGVVTIRIYQSGLYLYLEVENDGDLAEEEEAKIALLLSDGYDTAGEKAGNLGIRNVHQRVRILYGRDCGLSITKNGENSVLARIVIALSGMEQ